MPEHVQQLLRTIYDIVAELAESELDRYELLRAGIRAETQQLDPLALQQLLTQRLEDTVSEAVLLELYDAIRQMQSFSFGEPYAFNADNPSADAAISLAKRFGWPAKDTETVASGIKLAFFRAIDLRIQRMILEQSLRANELPLREYRLTALEKTGSVGQRNIAAETPGSQNEFSHAQQAIALHYLLIEGIGLSGVDTTRLMEFAHLLSAKKIPVSKDSGKPNIRNSGIKSAFNNAWKKDDANHVADLRFVLRFFRALDSDETSPIHAAVMQLEKRIAQIELRVRKTED